MIQSSDPVLRTHSKNVRKSLTDRLKERGFQSGLPYAIATNQLYMQLYGDTASGLKRRLGIRKRDPLRDAMAPEDLALAVLAEARIAACLSDPSVSVTEAITHVGTTLATLHSQCELT